LQELFDQEELLLMDGEIRPLPDGVLFLDSLLGVPKGHPDRQDAFEEEAGLRGYHVAEIPDDEAAKLSF